MTRVRPTTRPLAALLGLLAIVAAACGGEPADPNERLAEAFRATFEDDVAYRLVVDADREALDAMGEGAGQAAAFLTGFAIDGVIEDEAASARVQALGTDVLEVRSFGEDRLFVRLGIQQLLELVAGGGFAGEDIVPALDAMGVSQELQAAILDALSGRWVGIEGGIDAAELGALAGDRQAIDEEEAERAFQEAFGADLPAFFERYVTVVAESEDDDDDVETYHVALQLRDLLRAAARMNEDLGLSQDAALGDLEADLAELPETVPGAITIRGDVVSSVVFRIADTIRESGSEIEGDLDLVVDLFDHGATQPIAEPEDVTTVSSEELEELFRTLGDAASGLRPPGAGS